MEIRRWPTLLSPVVLAAALLAAAGCGGPAPRARQPQPQPRRVNTFMATAYCQHGITAAGVLVREGIVAADPAVLPLGSVIRVTGLQRPYNREYRVLDTGRGIRGREIDLYMPDCREAVRFGRRPAAVSVIRRPARDER